MTIFLFLFNFQKKEQIPCEGGLPENGDANSGKGR